MLTSFKINTAVLICLAFVFRLILVNTHILSSAGIPQPGRQSVIPSLEEYKNETITANTHTNEKSYVAVEICEEGSDIEEDVVKANPPVLLSFLYSIFKTENVCPGSDNSFDSIKCNLYPRKYLALSILRI